MIRKFSTAQANNLAISEIDVDLAAKEILFVIVTDEPGSFVGKLYRVSIENRDKMESDLFEVYSSLTSPLCMSMVSVE